MTKDTFVRDITNKLSKLIEPVPLEYQDRFDQNLLKNSLFRLKILAVFLLCSYVIQNVAFLFYVGGFDQFLRVLSDQNPVLNYVGCGSFVILILFLVFTRHLSKKKSRSTLWFWCYLVALYEVINSLLVMFFSDSAFSVFSYFTITFFVYLFVPDFRWRFKFILLLYILTALIASRLSISFLIEFQLMLFFIFLSMSLVKVSDYNSNIKVFVAALQMKELNENLLRANEKLESLSVTDELTKLNNRRSFMNYFEIIWKQAERLQLPVNTLMIDVDYFKQYNDSLGHLEGDKALIAVAECLTNQLKRETDFVARFGGEEFVCLLPYVTKEDAEDFAKKLVQSVENMKILHPKSECSQYVTISAGMASIVPNENDSLTQLLNEADNALYKAKQYGRNQVVTK